MSETITIYRVEAVRDKAPCLREGQAKRTSKGYKVTEIGTLSDRTTTYFRLDEAFESAELALLDFEGRQAQMQGVHELCARQCQENREWAQEMRREANERQSKRIHFDVSRHVRSYRGDGNGRTKHGTDIQRSAYAL